MRPVDGWRAGADELVQEASARTMSTITMAPRLCGVGLSHIAGRPVLPTIGRGPELVAKPDPVADGRGHKAEIALPWHGTCESFLVTNDSPPGHPSVGRCLHGVGKRASHRLRRRLLERWCSRSRQRRWPRIATRVSVAVVRSSNRHHARLQDEPGVRVPLGQALHYDDARTGGTGVVGVVLGAVGASAGVGARRPGPPLIGCDVEGRMARCAASYVPVERDKHPSTVGS